jgi:hypothetical protein
MQARKFLVALVLAAGCAQEPSEGPQIIYESGGNAGQVGRGGSSGRGGTGAGAGRGGASAAGGTAAGSGGSGAGGTASASGGTSGASDGGVDAVASGGTGAIGSGGSVGSAGSSGAATGGTAGTGGNAGTSTGGDGGPVTGFAIQYKVENTSASGTAIGSQLWIVNSGTSAVNLNDLTLRYYFTNEVTAALMQNVNWANVGPVSGGANMNLGSGELTIKTERMPAAVTGADSYVEFGFNAAGKTLVPGSRVQFSWTVQNFGSQNFDQTGDYSFNAGYTSQMNWQNVVLLQGQSVLWGVQP